MEEFYFDLLPLRAQPKDDESLTSVIIRIGARNRIKSLNAISTLLFPEHHPEVIRKCADFSPLGVKRLSKISHISETRLFETTFYYLAHNFGLPIVASRISRFLSGSLSKVLRYCPQCLAEDAFYHLTWRFNHIAACHRHRTHLLERCWCCRQDIPLFSMPPKIAVCPNCGAQLWKTRPKRYPVDDDSLEKAYQALGIILRPVACQDVYDVSNLSELMGHTLRTYRQSNKISREEVLEQLAIGSKHLESFERGSHQRSYSNFTLYLKYLNMLELSLHDVLTSSPSTKLQSPAKPLTAIPTLIKISKEEQYVQLVLKAMEDLSNSNQKITLKAAAKLIGVSLGTLCRYKKVRALSPYLRARTIRYQNQLTARISHMELAFRDLCKQGRVPGNDDIAKSVGFCVEQDPHLREWLRNRKLNAQVDIETPILERLNDVIKKLVSQGKLPTQNMICAEFGISTRTLWDKCPLVRQKIRDFRSQNQKSPLSQEQLILQIEKIREQIRAESVGETQLEIAKRLGRSLSNLRKYPSIKALFRGMPRNPKGYKSSDHKLR